MSLNSLHYDTCASYQRAVDSVGPGQYFIGVPSNRPSCTSCFAPDPRVRIQRTGYRPGITPIPDYYENTPERPLVDTESDLLGHQVLASRCQEPRSRLAVGDNNLEEGTISETNNVETVSCGLEADDTRLSNPASTLRGIGFNRWNPLCKNPQETPVQLPPFVNNVSSRILMKDNHRPIVPEVSNLEASVWPTKVIPEKKTENNTILARPQENHSGADVNKCFSAHTHFGFNLREDILAREEEIEQWTKEYYLK